MIVKNENLNFIFYCLIAFTFIKIVFLFLISFFKSEISENCVLKETAQTLKNFIFIINYEKLTFKIFFITFIKFLFSCKLRNIFSFKCFFIFYCLYFSH